MMISLPSKWIKANKLEKGDEVDVEEKTNSLIIGLDTKQISKKTEINLGSLTESSIRTILTNAYRLGYDKIKLNYQSSEALKHIKNIIDNNLVGFEIIKKTDKSCEIENITEPSKEQFDNILSKVFLNIDELFEIIFLRLKGKKQEFEQTEQKIQRFDNFCRRVIAKYELENSNLRWAFHSELIHAQRELYHLLRYLEKNKTKENKDISYLLEKSKEIFELLKKAYNEKNISLLEKIHDMEKELIYKEGYSFFKQSPVIIYHLLNSIRNFYLASSPLIGIFIVQEF